MNGRIRTAAIGFLFIFAAFLTSIEGTGRIFAADDKTTALPLSGLHGITVMIIIPEAERIGLERDQIQTEIESKLNKAGIKLLAVRELEKPGFPYLNIEVNVTKDKTPDLYIYNIKTELYKQEIQNPQDEIETAFQAVSVKTWSFERTGTSPGRSLKDNVQRQVDDAMDKFVTDYLAANPKK